MSNDSLCELNASLAHPLPFVHHCALLRRPSQQRDGCQVVHERSCTYESSSRGLGFILAALFVLKLPDVVRASAELVHGRRPR